MTDIRLLSKQSDNDSLLLAIKIVYSLSLDGKDRTLSLEDQINMFGLETSNVIFPNYIDNIIVPSIFFIIGFILGDGTLHIRLRKTVKGSIWVIPLLQLPQLKTEFTPHFVEMFMELFKSLGVTINTSTEPISLQKNLDIADCRSALHNLNDNEKINRMTVISIEGIENVFIKLLPLFICNSNYFYWKKPQLDLMEQVFKLVVNRAHSTLYGLNVLINIVYSYPNKRTEQKEYWLEIAQTWFDGQAKKLKSLHNNIQAVTGRGDLKGSIIA